MPSDKNPQSPSVAGTGDADGEYCTGGWLREEDGDATATFDLEEVLLGLGAL